MVDNPVLRVCQKCGKKSWNDGFCEQCGGALVKPVRKNLIIGDYRTFSQKPTDVQVRKTLMRLGRRAANYIKRKGLKPLDFTFDHIIRDSGLITPVWTVALKATQKVKA